MHAISYCTAEPQAQKVPGPCTQPLSGDSIRMTMSSIQQLEGSPEWHGVFEGYQQNEIYFPEIQPLEKVYRQLMRKLAQQIHDMGESMCICIAGVIQQLLRKPMNGVRMGDMPAVPTGSTELHSYIANRSNCLNLFLIQEVVKAIHVDELLDQCKDYERELAKCLAIPFDSGKRRKIPLIEADDLTSMSVEVTRNSEQFQISRVLTLQKHFQESIGSGFAFVQGYTHSSKVLYLAIPKAAVPFMPSLLLSHMAHLRQLEVQKIAVFGYFAVDLEEAQAYALVSASFTLRCMYATDVVSCSYNILPVAHAWQFVIIQRYVCIYTIAMYNHLLPVATAALSG